MDLQREKSHLKQRRGEKKNGIYSTRADRGQPDETCTQSVHSKKGRGRKKNSTWRVNCIIQHSTSCNRTKQEQYFCLKVIRYLSRGEKKRNTAQCARPEHRFIILIMSYGLSLRSQSSFVSHFIPMCIVARAAYKKGARRLCTGAPSFVI